MNIDAKRKKYKQTESSNILKGLYTPWPIGLIPEIQGWYVIWKSVNVIHFINKMFFKQNNHFCRCKNRLWQNTWSFHDLKKKNKKTLNKLGLKENFLSLVSTKYSVSTNTYRYLQNVLYLQNPTANIILYDERLNALPLRSRIRCKWNITQPQKRMKMGHLYWCRWT